MWWSRPRSANAAALLTTASLLLIGCGFQPLHKDGSGGGTSPQLALIHINPIENRIGQIMRNRLLDRLTPTGQPKTPRFVLTVKMEESTTEVAIRETYQATRENLTIATTYRLTDKRTKRLLNEGAIRVVTGYDLVSRRFSDLVARRHAQQRAAESTADDLAARLAVFFVDYKEAEP